MNGILGRKLGMSRIFLENGENVPVTIVEAGPCYVTQLKTKDKEGYSAVQLGFEELREKLINRPLKGHLKALERNLRVLREFKNFNSEDLKLGDEITVDIFKPGELVQVTGKSIGKGFTGVVKKYGFAGGPKTHGQSDRLRAPGSIGASSDPSRVWKGMKMPGHAGFRNVTVRNLLVVKTVPEKNLLFIKGAVPGPKEGLLKIEKI
jgi:large subunit ribosomal protein L3